jgi:hypothetical protein
MPASLLPSVVAAAEVEVEVVALGKRGLLA